MNDNINISEEFRAAIQEAALKVSGKNPRQNLKTPFGSYFVTLDKGEDCESIRAYGVNPGAEKGEMYLCNGI